MRTMQLAYATALALLCFAVQVSGAAPKETDSSWGIDPLQPGDYKSQQQQQQTENQLDNPLQLKRRLKKIDRLSDETLALGYLGDVWDADNDSESPTLRQVLFIHRHGDRTPTEFKSGDNLKDEPFWKFHGISQLTNRGKSRVYMLGKLVRRRYNKFLEGSVSKRQRISRSSGSLRCLESAELFLAGFLGLDQLTSPDASPDGLVWDRRSTHELAQLWQPAAVQSVPVKLDGMLAEGAECKVLSDENAAIESEVSKNFSAKIAKESQVLYSSIGYKLNSSREYISASDLIAIERSYFKDKMKPQVMEAVDRMQEISNLIWIASLRTHLFRLSSGLLINDILGHMKSVRNREIGTKKFVHYVAHDITLIVLLGMFDSIDDAPYRPDFAANLAIELHQEKDEWFLKIFYMQKVPTKPLEVHYKRCEEGHSKKRCTLDKLTELMQPYMIESWLAWLQECQNDLTQLNMYAPVS